MTTPTWPLYFRVRRLIRNTAFTATVEMVGRATWTLDFGKTWLYGVNPGAMAGCGEDLDGALRDFTEHLTGVLSDFADEAQDLDAFRQIVERFVRATDDDSVAEWEAVREMVRRGASPDVSLVREERDLEPGVDVQPALQASSPAVFPTEHSTGAGLTQIAA